jgi:hypothetical protein
MIPNRKTAMGAMPGGIGTPSEPRKPLFGPQMKTKLASALERVGRPGDLSTPEGLQGRQDRWGKVFDSSQQVYTPTPLTAVAKALTGGLAGYQQSKAQRQEDEGRQAWSDRMSKALTGGEDPMAAMADPWASAGDKAMLSRMWERSNPTEAEQLDLDWRRQQMADAQKPKAETWTDNDGNRWSQLPGQKATISWDAPDEAKSEWINIPGPGGKGNIPIDISTPKGQAIYNQYMEQFAEGAQGEGGGIPTADIDDEMKVMKQAEAGPGVSRFREVQPIISSMQQSLSDNTGQADLDFIYGLAKIMDPESVVREGEMATVQSSSSIPDQYRGMLMKAMAGEGSLTPEVRRNLYEVARRRVSGLHKQAEREIEAISNYARGSNMDPNRVVRPLDPLPKWEDQNIQGPAAAAPRVRVDINGNPL